MSFKSIDSAAPMWSIVVIGSIRINLIEMLIERSCAAIRANRSSRARVVIDCGNGWNGMNGEREAWNGQIYTEAIDSSNLASQLIEMMSAARSFATRWELKLKQRWFRKDCIFRGASLSWSSHIAACSSDRHGRG